MKERNMKMKHIRRLAGNLPGVVLWLAVLPLATFGQANYATPYTFATLAGNTGYGSADGTNSATGFGAERQMLRGHLPAAVTRLNLRPIGRLSATNRLNLAIGLPLRNTNALSKLLQDMYDPASPQFRHYLIPEQFTEQFGSTKQDYEAVRQFARKYGLDVTVTHSKRVLLDVAGQVML